MLGISTRLYNLKPIGLHTGLVERQTSYIARLAEAHLVTVGTLIGQEVAPLLGKNYLTKSSENGGNGFYHFGFELNGFGTLANDFTQGLSELTGCSTLKNLTLVNLHDLIPTRGVLRKTKAWCSMCLEEWKRHNTDIYEPLAWSFKEVNICTRHGVRLKTQCPSCINEIPVLSRKSRNGFCSFCGCWLGCSHSQIDGEVALEHALWEHFRTENVEDLLEIRDNPAFNLSFGKMHTFLKLMVDKAGGKASFSRSFDIPKTTVCDWYEGRSKPSLKALLKIFYGVGIKTKEVFGNNQIQIFMLTPDNHYAVPEKRDTNITKRTFDWRKMEAILKDIITNEVVPPPSVCEVAKGLQCSRRLLYNHFPSLCREISAKHASYVQLRKFKRIEEDCKKISEATMILYNSGIYPSRRKIEKLLSPNIILREKAYQIAWKETLSDLGLIKL